LLATVEVSWSSLQEESLRRFPLIDRAAACRPTALCSLHLVTLVQSFRPTV